MPRACRLVRAGRSVDSQWRRDGDTLIVAPKDEPPLVMPLAEISGFAGDGFAIRMRVPDGEVALERLGADGPTLMGELQRDWLPLRAAVLRLTGGERPAEVFSGFLSAGGRRGPFRGFFVGERLIIAPEGGDVAALFVADFASLHFDEEAYVLRARGWGGQETQFSKLGGRSSAFAGALLTVRETLARAAGAAFAQFLPSLAAGARASLAAQWLPGRLLSFETLERVAPGFSTSFDASWLQATPRATAGRELMSGVAAGDRFLAYAVPGEGEPSVWLLVLRGPTASLEMLSQGDYATYLFHNGTEIPELVEGLVRLPEFSREALYAPLEQLTGDRAIYAIPARDLPLLRELRSRFAGRKVHASAAPT